MGQSGEAKRLERATRRRGIRGGGAPPPRAPPARPLPNRARIGFQWHAFAPMLRLLACQVLLLSSAWGVVHYAGKQKLSRLQRARGLFSGRCSPPSGRRSRRTALRLQRLHTEMAIRVGCRCSSHAEDPSCGTFTPHGPQVTVTGECGGKPNVLGWRSGIAPLGDHLIFGIVPNGVGELGVGCRWAWSALWASLAWGVINATVVGMGVLIVRRQL